MRKLWKFTVSRFAESSDQGELSCYSLFVQQQRAILFNTNCCCHFPVFAGLSRVAGYLFYPSLVLIIVFVLYFSSLSSPPVSLFPSPTYKTFPNSPYPLRCPPHWIAAYFVLTSLPPPTSSSFLSTDFNPIAVIVFVNVLLFCFSRENCFFIIHFPFGWMVFHSRVFINSVGFGGASDKKFYFFSTMINVTRMKSPTYKSIFVTSILKLFMTLLWSGPHTDATWQNWWTSFL